MNDEYGPYWTPGPWSWGIMGAVVVVVGVILWLDLRRRERRQKHLEIRERETFIAFESAVEHLEEYIVDNAPRKRIRRAAVAVVQAWSDWQEVVGRHDEHPPIVQQAGRLALILEDDRRSS